METTTTIDNGDYPQIITDSVVHWIHPATPTRLDGLQRMPLPGLDQVFHSIDAMILLPGPLDTQRLKVAIALGLAAYPHAAGRVKRLDSGLWIFELAFHPVPLTVCSSPLIVTDALMKSRNGYADLVDPIPWDVLPPKDIETHPLVRFKLVNLVNSGETAFTIHACHALGDATTIFKFLKTISDYYEAPSGIPSIPLPTYERYLHPPPPALSPSSAEYASLSSQIPNLLTSYPDASYRGLWNQMISNSQRVDLTFTLRQMKALQRRAAEETGEKLSYGDALVAYVWRAINLSYPENECCTRLMNVVQFRSRSNGPTEDEDEHTLPGVNAAGNIRLPLVSPPIPQSSCSSLGALSLVVRSLVSSTYSPQSIAPVAGLADSLLRNMAAENQIASLIPMSGCIGASLMHKGGFHSAHFGYPYRVKFYTLNEPVERYIRVVPANPEIVNGKWRSNDGAVEVCLRVRNESKTLFEEIVKRGLAELEETEGFTLKSRL